MFGRGQGKTSVLPFLTRVGTRAREWKGNVFVNVSAGAGTKANARAAAHLRLVIFVSLRMAASTEAPLAPMWLPERLQEIGEVWGQ